MFCSPQDDQQRKRNHHWTSFHLAKVSSARGHTNTEAVQNVGCNDLQQCAASCRTMQTMNNRRGCRSSHDKSTQRKLKKIIFGSILRRYKICMASLQGSSEVRQTSGSHTGRRQFSAVWSLVPPPEAQVTFRKGNSDECSGFRHTREPGSLEMVNSGSFQNITGTCGCWRWRPRRLSFYSRHVFFPSVLTSHRRSSSVPNSGSHLGLSMLSSEVLLIFLLFVFFNLIIYLIIHIR